MMKPFYFLHIIKVQSSVVWLKPNCTFKILLLFEHVLVLWNSYQLSLKYYDILIKARQCHQFGHLWLKRVVRKIHSLFEKYIFFHFNAITIRPITFFPFCIHTSVVHVPKRHVIFRSRMCASQWLLAQDGDLPVWNNMFRNSSDLKICCCIFIGQILSFTHFKCIPYLYKRVAIWLAARGNLFFFFAHYLSLCNLSRDTLQRNKWGSVI